MKPAGLRSDSGHRAGLGLPGRERHFCIDNLRVRIHSTIKMIWWTGLAPWEFLDVPASSCPVSHSAFRKFERYLGYRWRTYVGQLSANRAFAVKVDTKRPPVFLFSDLICTKIFETMRFVTLTTF